MSIYIHIPFCTKICTYCDFPKVTKNSCWIDEYLDSLENEIKINYKGEEIDTLYIGGGTPTCLNLRQLKRLFNIIKMFKLDENAEITIEANSEDLTLEKIELIKKNVNRLSIGIQTFDKNILKKLNRSLNVQNVISASKHIDNINLDLMYAYPNQTLEDLKKDLDIITQLNPSHISTYSLIVEPNTVMYIKKTENIDEDTDRKMFDYIDKYLKEKGYIHYEISNYAKKGYESKHNLTYWNNEQYYGFGLGASGYVDGVRYENSRSLTEYLKKIYKKSTNTLNIDEKLQNEFILGFRKLKGINKKAFKDKYDVDIKSINEIKKLLDKKILKEDSENVFIDDKYIYISNEILIKFIDLTLPKQKFVV